MLKNKPKISNYHYGTTSPKGVPIVYSYTYVNRINYALRTVDVVGNDSSSQVYSVLFFQPGLVRINDLGSSLRFSLNSETIGVEDLGIFWGSHWFAGNFYAAVTRKRF